MNKLASIFNRYGALLKAKKGRILFGVDDPPTKIYLVKEGAIKIYRYTEDGKEVMLHIHGQGELITISPLFKDMDHVVYAESLIDTDLLWIPISQFKELIKEDAATLLEIGRSLSDNWDEVEERIEAFVTHDSLGRLAYIISQLAKKHGTKKSSKTTIPFPLTHQELANLTGMFRETISISIQELKKAGIISIEKHYILVEDSERLEECARSGKQAMPKKTP
ncbi:MAG: Crp/Fnr family transcriptional regulator [Candidatus Woykebacteria bacterium]